MTSRSLTAATLITHRGTSVSRDVGRLDLSLIGLLLARRCGALA
ncbi:MAG TPA: hypothetical protein VEZ88_07310 [Steroidobacteraceae bacterium]|nr:hypothetical protein [Steroidobacteraceae bacterium]